MAAVSRQPFAPLDGARLQSLTSVKNRQNNAAPGKRKAADADADWENVDPLLSVKRSKAASSDDAGKKPCVPAPRRMLQPKSPVARLSAPAARSSPVSAPAGRSPTRARRAGILSSRRRSGPASYARVDPPAPTVGASAPFSLDAALKGTIPGYGSRRSAAAPSRGGGLDIKASWFFDIHEDTPEQEMTNLLQHGTCVLDISSDEESERRARRDKDEGRDKENIPPADDVSQPRGRRAAAADAMALDRPRVALGEMKTADFYPDGCDEASVVLVPGDELDEPDEPPPPPPPGDAVRDVDLLMSASHGSSKAAVLQPIEGTGESFELWESGSAKDETEP